MAEISVSIVPSKDGWTFGVQVAESNGQTRHTVTLSQDDYQRLTSGKETTPEALVKRSFEFLLKRGAKQHIQRQFELATISRLFPEYPADILKRL